MNYPERYMVTAALPYANGPLHIGHLAGAYLSPDIYCRFQKLMGKDVCFICGSDEHGAAITMRAKKEGVTPQEIIDKYHKQFQESFKGMGIQFDHYDRTSSQEHHKTAQDFFLRLYEKGVFEEIESEQYYDASAEQFLADRYIMGTCPKCGYKEAYGDQCEKCGSTLSPTDLIDPQSTLTGEKPELRKTTHWYLPLNKEEKWLKEWIENGTVEGKALHEPDKWKAHVIGQCKSWIDNGLQARAMTRDLEWGVDVPSSIKGAEGKKLYVWLDAPIGYISSTKKWAEEKGKDWKKYWQDEDAALIHFIGKDNIVFHCIIFPSLLKEHGDFILPQNVPANQFMNLEGEKISTSRNWAVWVHEYLEDFPDKVDVLRYALTRIMPENRDSEFTWKSFQEFNNNELVNSLANFINRVLVLTNKYYDGIVPEFDEDLEIAGSKHSDDPSFHDAELIDLVDLLIEYGNHIRDFDFRGGLQKMMEIAARGNQLLQFNEPWKLVKSDEDTVKVIMNLSLQIVVSLSLAIRPFMPFTAAKLRELLNLPEIMEEGELLEMMNQLAEGELPIKAGHQINEAEHLFSRIDDDLIDQQMEKLKKRAMEEKDEPKAPEIKDTIEFDDFMRLDLRTAKILEAEKVPKSDKLIEIKLDLGFEKRTVVSGIAEYFEADEIEDKQVVLVANLAPRKIFGIKSQGMILMAEDPSGNLRFVKGPEDTPLGSIVK
jgi:methionyl-tRNA synthetase